MRMRWIAASYDRSRSASSTKEGRRAKGPFCFLDRAADNIDCSVIIRRKQSISRLYDDTFC